MFRCNECGLERRDTPIIVQKDSREIHRTSHKSGAVPRRVSDQHRITSETSNVRIIVVGWKCRNGDEYNNALLRMLMVPFVGPLSRRRKCCSQCYSVPPYGQGHGVSKYRCGRRQGGCCIIKHKSVQSTAVHSGQGA